MAAGKKARRIEEAGGKLKEEERSRKCKRKELVPWFPPHFLSLSPWKSWNAHLESYIPDSNEKLNAKSKLSDRTPPSPVDLIA